MERERERAACEGKLNTLGSRQLVTRDVVQLSRLSHPLFLDSPLYSTYLLQPRSFFHSDLSPSRLLLLLSFSLSLCLLALFPSLARAFSVPLVRISIFSSFSAIPLELTTVGVMSLILLAFISRARPPVRVCSASVYPAYTYYYSVTSGYYTGGLAMPLLSRAAWLSRTKGTASRHRW